MTGQDKPTKISFVYSNPTDPDAFETAYLDQIALARKLPGLTRLQTSKVWPKEDGSPTPAYRLLDLYFADYAAARHLGVSARDCYQAGLRGALCDRQTMDRLRQAGEAFDWAGLAAAGQA